MKDIETKIIQLRDRTWQIARDSLDSGETHIYRTLTDITEKLTNLISSSDKIQIDIGNKGKMIPIFALYKGKRYEAELDLTRIHAGHRECVLKDGKWRTASGSTRLITDTSVNGWRHFWKYIKDGKIVPIESLKNKVN